MYTYNKRKYYSFLSPSLPSYPTQPYLSQPIQTRKAPP